jgi:hypothetical protein
MIIIQENWLQKCSTGFLQLATPAMVTPQKQVFGFAAKVPEQSLIDLPKKT